MNTPMNPDEPDETSSTVFEKNSLSNKIGEIKSQKPRNFFTYSSRPRGPSSVFCKNVLVFSAITIHNINVYVPLSIELKTSELMQNQLN